MASSFDSCLSVTASSGAVASGPMILPDFLISSFGMPVSLAVVRPPARHAAGKKAALALNQMKCFPNASDLFFDLGKSP